MFYVAYRTLLVFCVLKFYFVDFNGMFTSSPSSVMLQKNSNEKETSSTLIKADKSELTDAKELKNLERRLKSWEKRPESRHA